jgi:glycosyltransferase involved in cell wall biosynthesis
MTINASGSSAWVCCQLGAREHYAVPRALARHSVLDQIITDAWVPRRSLLARIDRSQKSEVRCQRSDVGGRWHQDLKEAAVTSFNWSLVAFEMLARARRLRGWPLIMARNDWFQRKVVGYLSSYRLSVIGSQVTLFAYSYAGLEILKYAKTRGWKTVLGQIDPGPVEEKIVADEATRVPELAGDWQPAPPEYWENWQEECSLADHIIVNSEWSRTCLVEAGVNGSKLSVVPLAYEMTGQQDYKTTDNTTGRKYPARFTPDRPLRVLFLGQVNLRKGVARLFDAIRQLRNEPVEFEFVGRVQVAVPADLKNNARVRWFGAVPRGKTDDFYRTADVLIFPTLSDGFGLTQLEAQARGLPVIASRCCGEVVKHGVNGLLLDEPVADAIVEALQFCLADPSRLAAFSAASRIEDRFSLDSLAQNLLSLNNA